MAGAGYLEPRGDNSWRLNAFAGYDPATRKRQYVRESFRGTKRDATKALAALVAKTNEQRDAGVDFAHQATVLQTLRAWLDSKRAVLSPSTVDRYRIAIKHVEESPAGGLLVSKLRPHHIEDLYASLLADGQSGSSIRKVHWALRGALAWAHRRGYTTVVATDGIELPPLGERKLRPPSSENVWAVIERALEANPEWGTLIAFVAWTGCRRGEVCGLRWGDLDFERRSALFVRSVVAIPGGVQVKGTKTGDVRRIALGTHTISLLLDHRATCCSRAVAGGVGRLPDGYVFSPSLDGEHPYNPHTITHAFVRACKQAGVPPMRLHDLRHHSATGLLKNGSSVGEVMDRHGWRSVAMVNRYRHLLDAEDGAAAEAVESFGRRRRQPALVDESRE
ncbi:MAG: tyrosine-type recombinase/integrase [Acidimicrobiales bacterium]